MKFYDHIATLFLAAFMLTSCNDSPSANDTIDFYVKNRPRGSGTAVKVHLPQPDWSKYDTIVLDDDSIYYHINRFSNSDAKVYNVEGIFPQLSSEMELEYRDNIMQAVMSKHELRTIVSYKWGDVHSIKLQATPLTEIDYDRLRIGALGKFRKK